MVVCLITWALASPSSQEVFTIALGESGRMLLGAGFVLLFTIPMVRIYINSGMNPLELPAMPIAMAQWAADNVGNIYPMVAPSVGALGSIHRREQHSKQPHV